MDLEEFSNIVVRHGLHHSKKNLKQYLDVLFGTVDFQGKSFLDIGGGTGLFTHYAAFKGASRSVCMEPEDDGSTSGVTEKFTKVKEDLNAAGQVELDYRLFQDYDGEPFDIILLHNSVNHLDEEACESVLTSEESRLTYVGLFEKLNKLLTPNGLVIICDCGRRNFFGDLGLTNPVMKSIEWHKHQQPKVWGELLEKSGFKVETIRWNTFNTLGKFGAMLLGYSIPSYFSLSHFRMYVRNIRK